MKEILQGCAGGIVLVCISSNEWHVDIESTYSNSLFELKLGENMVCCTEQAQNSQASCS